MNRLVRSFLCVLILAITGSCSNVGFRSPQPEEGAKGCTGSVCPNGQGYAWHEGGFGLCSKPCGGGDQTENVDCRRTSDDVVVPDSNCTGTKPAGSRTCNLATCTATYTWNLSDYGTCSKTCGGGVKTRTVICQDSSGNTVADSFCTAAKPSNSLACNSDPCSNVSYGWVKTVGTCSKQCGGGTATDTVVCKKNDGSVQADTFCDAATKPSTAPYSCNPQSCPQTYTYAWEPGAFGTCSKSCGPGMQTRSVACKRNDNAYVAESYCDAATKPGLTQSCNIATCQTGTPVTQTETVKPASNSVDVVLVIDDSSSMKDDQTKLAARLINFVNDLDALNIDYQMCLTTTDVGYYKGSPIMWQGTGSVILNKATPNKNSVFTSTVDSLGAEWSSDEQPVKATYEMIHDFGPNSGSTNSGCFRAGATLTVIMISDEDERSVGGNQALSTAQYQPLTSENMPSTLVSLVHSTFDKTGFVKPFLWNSIIVKPGDKACEAQQDAPPNSPSFPGTFAAQLSNTTGGQMTSICDSDYANNLTLIKNKIVSSMPGLTMQCTPTGSAGVTFSPPFATTITQTGNQLKFSPALPENTVVTAKYTCP